MSECTVVVSFSELGAGLVVDEVDANALSVLRHAAPASAGKTRQLACLRPLLDGLEVRMVDEFANVLPTRGIGIIEVRGGPLSPGYATMAPLLGGSR